MASTPWPGCPSWPCHTGQGCHAGTRQPTSTCISRAFVKIVNSTEASPFSHASPRGELARHAALPGYSANLATFVNARRSWRCTIHSPAVSRAVARPGTRKPHGTLLAAERAGAAGATVIPSNTTARVHESRRDADLHPCLVTSEMNQSCWSKTTPVSLPVSPEKARHTSCNARRV